MGGARGKGLGLLYGDRQVGQIIPAGWNPPLLSGKDACHHLRPFDFATITVKGTGHAR
jgi:hypothetical protein